MGIIDTNGITNMTMEDKHKVSQCYSCVKKDVCKFANDMDFLENEFSNKINVPPHNLFIEDINIKCKYYEEKHTIKHPSYGRYSDVIDGDNRLDDTSNKRKYISNKGEY